MKTKCIIIDDEPLALEVIESHLTKFDDIEIVAKCNSAIKAMEVLNKKSIDLMFLDIQMPKITGIDFLKSLKKTPKVILTTAYREYALEGYELDVVDYLLKPISFERFFKSINKYYQTKGNDIDFIESNINEQKDSFIYVKSNKKVLKIFINKILYFESTRDYVDIHTTEGTITVKQLISNFESNLPENLFIRIHRSFIISITKITSFSSSTIELNGETLPIGGNYKTKVFNALNYDCNII